MFVYRLETHIDLFSLNFKALVDDVAKNVAVGSVSVRKSIRVPNQQ
jgi:hypothetical protein